MAPSPARAQDQRFSSRWTLVLSVLGIAVGTGNIWRFPRIAAANGGEDGAGAFLVAWLVFLAVWSLPLIVAEYALGQKGRRGVVGTFARLAGPQFGWMGAFVGAVAALIMCYYSVVTGWCFFYFAQAVAAAPPPDTASAMATWDGFQGSWWPVALHALAFGVGAWTCRRGVASIERVSRVLVPALLVIVVLAAVRAVTLPGAGAGLAYLFTPDWSDLARPGVWLEALTQNAWDTGAGWGLILTYAAYMRLEHGVVRNAFLTGVGNNVVSLLAAVTIFATTFALLGSVGAAGGGPMGRGEVLEVMRTSGPAGTGLTFIWMPQLFAAMPLGRALSVLFFLALSFAALTSLISMIELATRVLVDMGIERRRAVLGVAAAGFLVGLPSATSLTFFANQDFVWGVALILSGAFVAFAAVRYGTDRLRRELATPTDWAIPPVWSLFMRVLVPAQAVVLLLWWLGQATTSAFAERWYDPLEPFSAMTVLVQWALLLALLLALNGWYVRRTLAPKPY